VTPETKHTETHTCLVKGVTLKQKSDGSNYYDVQLQFDHDKYPRTIKCWDWKQLESLVSQPNTRHALIFQRDKLKDGKDDDGKWESYWWQVLGLAETVTQEIPRATPTAPATPVPDHRRATATVPQQHIPGADPRQRSIERQVAFKAAVDLALHTLHPGENHDWPDDETLFDWIQMATDRLHSILDREARGPAVQPATHQSTHLPEFCQVHNRPFNFYYDERTMAGQWAHKDQAGQWCRFAQTQAESRAEDTLTLPF